MRSACLALLVLALTPAVAQAAPTVELTVAEKEVQLGTRHELSGMLLDGIVPLANQQVVLEGKRYPYDGDYQPLGSGMTDAQGRFAFVPKLDRNYRLRVSAPAQDAASKSQVVYTLPAFDLSFKSRKAGVVRFSQDYRVPRAVRLKAKTIFYVGPRRSKRSTIRISARTRRVRAGRYGSRVTVTLPSAWHGRFQFGSCFGYSGGSGLGNPHVGCPKRFRF